MGSIVGKVTDAVGITDNKGAKASRAEAERQARRSEKLTDAEIAFQREQYTEWKDIYGPLQEDLGTYYKNLTGDNLAAKHIESIQQESQAVQLQIDEELAQRGLAGSGLEAETLRRNIFQTGLAKANIRASAEELAAEKKKGFLGLGLGQGTQMLATQAGVSGTGVSSATNLSTSALSAATNLKTAGMEAIGEIAGIGAGRASDIRLKKNVTLVDTIRGIKFYNWTWNNKAKELGLNGEGFGVIAQEVKDVIPDSTFTKDGYIYVNYEAILAYIKEK